MALKTPFAGYLPVELALLDIIGLGELTGPTPTEAKPVSQERSTPRPAQPKTEQTAPPTTPPSIDSDLESQWNRIISEMRKHSPKTQAMLRGGRPLGIEGDTFVISFRHDFHREQVQGSIDLVIEVVSAVMGRPLAVQLVGDADALETDVKPTIPQDETASPPIESDPTVRKAIDELGARISKITPPENGKPPETTNNKPGSK